MRPTGRLHLGNYMGALYNWVRLQDEYDCYFFIADLHALTTDYADPSQLPANIREVTLDFLAAGLDPERSVLFMQSDVTSTPNSTCSSQHVHPARLARARPHLQRPAGATPREGPHHLRLPRLPAPPGRRHPPLSARLRPRRPGPGRPRRAHPRSRPPLQRPLPLAQPTPAIEKARSRPLRQGDHRRRALAASNVRERNPPRAQSSPHPLAQTPRPRRPQDVQELRQHHPALRARGRNPRQAQDHGHRPRPHPPHRSRQPRHLPRLRPAQGLLHLRRSSAKASQAARTAGIGCIQCKGWARRRHRLATSPPSRSAACTSNSTPARQRHPQRRRRRATARADKPCTKSARPWASSNPTCTRR